jgi:hypothetical protein
VEEGEMRTKPFIIASLVTLLLTFGLLGVPVVPRESPAEKWVATQMFLVRSQATVSPTGLSPTQIRLAYNLPALGGLGTIAIIDAFDDPTVQSDIAVFSNQFNLSSTNLEVHKKRFIRQL